MNGIRIFSYLPNPRVYKATITARFNNVPVEVIGASPPELREWLWDFDARPLTDEDRANPDFAIKAEKGFSGELFKTPAFLAAHPYGTVPAAFSADGETGIFESNSIMRAVARLGNDTRPLYGSNPYEASRIDGFLDTALLFARASQVYLLAIGDRSVNVEIRADMEAAARSYLTGIENALTRFEHLAGSFSIADICFACELALFARERAAFRVLEKIDQAPIWDSLTESFPNSVAYLDTLVAIPEINADLGNYMAKIDADIAARQ